MVRKWFIIAVMPLMLGNSAPGSVSVNVTGLTNTSGQLVACIWQDRSGFPTCGKSDTAIRRVVPITATNMTVRFTNIPAGNYAVTVEHDEDGNGKLKTNFLGMPKEGVGVSNNPGGIPRWSNAQIRVEGRTVMTIRMRYL